ncbi:MAG: winged helix-turn-helix transcriptional regulator [Sporichthyaceae bacterium]
MLDSEYPDQACSVARALEVVGERWTLLILRDVLFGKRRFDELSVSVAGVTRTVLASRLRKLVEHGLLERRLYQERPERFEYLPTAKAIDLAPALAHLMRWGDEYYPHPAGPPRRLLHRECGGDVETACRCLRCGRDVDARQVDGPVNPALLSLGT